MTIEESIERSFNSKRSCVFATDSLAKAIFAAKEIKLLNRCPVIGSNQPGEISVYVFYIYPESIN